MAKHVWRWVLPAVVAAGAGWAAPAAAQEIHVGPFLQTATPTSIWVIWETVGGEESRVDYGTTEALGQRADGELVQSVEAGHLVHQTPLTGLAPDTRYHYRVTTGAATSELLHFRTPPLPGQERSFRFLVDSDTQRDGANPDQHADTVSNGMLGYMRDELGLDDPAEAFAFLMTAGDLVDNGLEYEHWKRDYFDEAQPLIQHLPLYPVLGNHEKNAPSYFRYFRLPDSGETGFFAEHWYAVDYSNVRIIGMDSNEVFRLPRQLAFLEGALADACARPEIDFVFAQLHHPYKSELWLPGEAGFTGLVIDRLERFSTECGKPSAHFFGHTHAYSRGQSRDHDHVWVNAASGEGNVDYWGEEPQEDYPEFQRSFPEWGFLVVEVTAGESPSFTIKRLSRGNEIVAKDNELIDEITLRRDNQPPARPSAVGPVPGRAPVPAERVVLQASPYADPDGGAHLESHFQVSAVAGDFSTPVAESWVRFENWYAPPGATGPADGYYSVNTVTDPDITKAPLEAMPPDRPLHWRVRYRDENLGWSPWSGVASFTTAPSVLGPNVLENPGGEAGTQGWSGVGKSPLESVAAGECGVAGGPAEGSRFLVVGGACEAAKISGRARQRVDVSAYADAIDAGAVSAFLGGGMRDRNGKDRPRMWLSFRPAFGARIGSSEVLAAATTGWSWRGDVVAVPPGTRRIDVELGGLRLEGPANDSYFDGMFLAVGNASCPADLDGDGSVGSADVARATLGLGACTPGRACPGDLDADGSVTLTDIAAINAASGPCD